MDGKKNRERGREILAGEKDLCKEAAISKASKAQISLARESQCCSEGFLGEWPP